MPGRLQSGIGGVQQALGKVEWSLYNPSILRIFGGAQRPGAANLTAAMADLAPSRIRAFPAEVEDLKRKLASSRQELIASQHKLDALTKANTQLRALMIRREHEPACAPSPSSSRRLTDLFLSTGLDPFAMARMDQLVAERVRLLKGGRIYHAGEAFKALYMIRVGSCKTVLLSTCGESQIAAHYLAGEIVGTDGIGTGVHK